MEYRGLKKIPVGNHYQLPIKSKLQDYFRGAKIFKKMDLKNGYHLMRLTKENEWKIVVPNRSGLYEFIVMAFRLTITRVTFQDMMNHILKDLLNEGVVGCFDNVLIKAHIEDKHN
jgi:hypothetical protein